MTQVIVKNSAGKKAVAAPPAPAKAAPKGAVAPVKKELSRADKAAQTRKANQAAKAAGTSPAKSGAKLPTKATSAPAAQETETSTGRVGRKELAEAIYGKLREDLTPVPLKLLVSAVAYYEEVVADALAAGREVQLPGFGKFVVTAKEAREGRNPKTGEAVQIEAYNQVRFKVGASLKAKVNGGAEASEEGEAETE